MTAEPTHEPDAGDAAGDENAADSGAAAEDSSHLDDIEDGAGCTEIWERLSERREE